MQKPEEPEVEPPTPADAWQRIERLFGELADLPPEDQRARLEAARAEDPETSAEVGRLLDADAKSGRLIESSIAAATASFADDEDAIWLGRTVGAYRLVRRVGRGGMSSVYLGVRSDDQFEQRVALKLVRRGMGSDEVLRRFLAERRILGRLEHPNIARILDGGTTADGQPYFVMEHIEGLAIDRFCDERGLGLVERLRLFLGVCSAVQFAHRNLVVHRDLKPSNVLVTADGIPKLLDFGIAKLLDPAQGEGAAERTAAAVRPMTLAYASPEQIRGEAVTTASDVYSLGVLLYELVTGLKPFDADQPPTALERAICEEEPERASACVRRLAMDASWRGASGERARRALLERRRERPEALARRLAGDLDTILAMALRKEPERRYGSVQQLADDLGRTLAGHPVSARPDALAYRAAKFLRRHPAGVAMAGAAALGLVAVSVWTSVQSREVARERDRLAGMTQVLTGMFEIVNRRNVDELNARQLLAHGEDQIRTLSDQPENQAMLWERLGLLYDDISLYSEALRVYEEALAGFRAVHGERSLAVARVLQQMGRAAAQGGEYRRAQELFGQALELRRELLAPNDPILATSLNGLALVASELGDQETAERRYLEAITVLERSASEDDFAATIRANYALLLWDIGEYARAGEIYRAQVARLEGASTEDSRVALAEVTDLLGWNSFAEGRFLEAERTLRRALELRLKAHPAEHTRVARTESHLGVTLLERGELAEAEVLIRAALDKRRRLRGEENDEVAESFWALGALLTAQGRIAEADAELARAAALYARVLAERHPFVGRVQAELAALRAGRGDCAGAARPIADARAMLPPKDWRLQLANLALGTCSARAGDHAAARPLLASAHAALERRWGAEHPAVREAALWLRSLGQ